MLTICSAASREIVEDSESSSFLNEVVTLRLIYTIIGCSPAKQCFQLAQVAATFSIIISGQNLYKLMYTHRNITKKLAKN
jgi:hypothetical protein